MAVNSVAAIGRLPPLPGTRDILRMYKLKAIKQLSQNFIMDSRLTYKIVKAAGYIKDGHVCEVGPGPGNITRSILARGASHITVIEKDSRFLPSLELLQDACGGHLDVILGDVLTYNMAETFPAEMGRAWEDSPPNIHILGNLPFSVSTPLIIRWLHAISNRENAWKYGRVQLTLTFQKEVAERLVAPVGPYQRCRLSIMAQHLCHVKHAFTIPGRAFVPKPNVDVGVVHMTPLVEPIIKKPFKLVEKIARQLFSFRQKTCVKGAETLFPADIRKQLTAELFLLADVTDVLRPYQLTVEEVGRLCEAFDILKKENPIIDRYEYRVHGKHVTSKHLLAKLEFDKQAVTDQVTASDWLANDELDVSR